MTPTTLANIRNIAFCGNGSAGKTMLLDKILTATGTIKRPASVDDGTSVCDFDEEEKHHKHTIESSLVHFRHEGVLFNVIDTPGYPDFVGQALGPLHAVETAAIVVDAHSGPGVNTRRMFQEAGKLGLGRVIIVTKMDSDNVDFTGLLHNIQEMFGKTCIPWNVPIGVGPSFKGVCSTMKVPAKHDGTLIDPGAGGHGAGRFDYRNG